MVVVSSLVFVLLGLVLLLLLLLPLLLLLLLLLLVSLLLRLLLLLCECAEEYYIAMARLAGHARAHAKGLLSNRKALCCLLSSQGVVACLVIGWSPI